jgi:16S rRNA processing protein RimM
MTVKVASGEAARWTGLTAVFAGAPAVDASEEPVPFEVERARAYRDRLVLKLKGVDDPNAAEALKGKWILAPAAQIPALPEDVYFVERLVGREVVNERGDALGRVEDVLATGGVDLLVVRGSRGAELLVPLARSIVLEVGEGSGPIVVRLPEGLAPEEPRSGEPR